MARVGSAFTGEDDDTEAPLRSIMGGGGALQPLLGDPASRAALLQIGLNLMQPAAMGQTTAGALAQGIGSGGEVEARLSKEEFERQKHEDELDKTQRTLDIRQQEADAYKQAQATAATRAGTQDKLTLEALRQQGRMALLGAKNYAVHAKNTADQVNDITFDPKRPENAPLLRFQGKTPSQIETMLREEDAAGGSTVAPARGAVPPPVERVVGQTYQTPKGPLMWNGSGWVVP